MKSFQLSGIVGVDILAANVKQMLTDANGEDVAFDLSSIGGYAYDGLQIFNAIRDYTGKKTVTLNGYVASCASYISCAFDTIKAKDNSIFMIHNAVNSAFGDYRALQKEANELKALNNVIGTGYANKTKAPIKKMLALMDDETYFYGAEIKEAGFADEIIESGSSDNKAAAIANAKAQLKALNLSDRSDDISKAFEYLNSNGIVRAREAILSGAFDNKTAWSCNESDELIYLDKMAIGKNGIIYRSALRIAGARTGQTDKQLSATISDLIKLIDKNNISGITGGHKVDKSELLATVVVMKDNAQITLPEIAKAMNLSELIITDEQRKAANTIAKLSEMGISDPVAVIETMQKQERENSEAVRNAAIDKVFGIAEDNGVQNLARVYAGDKLKGVQAKELDAKIEELKKDPIMQKFTQERADVFSSVNMRDPSGSTAPVDSATMRIDKV